MKIIYAPRCAFKTTELVRLSAETNTPILCQHPSYIVDLAKELALTIPAPIDLRDYKPRTVERILVDDAEVVLSQLLGAKIDAMTLSDERGITVIY